MANLFDRAYDKLTSLHEDFTSKAEADKFLGSFLVALLAEFGSALPNTQWRMTDLPHNTSLLKVGGNNEIATDATISVRTVDFDLTTDFDYANPISKSGGAGEQYKFRRDLAPTIITLKDFITNFTLKNPSGLASIDPRFPDVGITILATKYDKEPYTYKYTSAVTAKPKISKYADALEVQFEIRLKYIEIPGAAVNPANIKTVKSSPHKIPEAEYNSTIDRYLDKEFWDYDIIDKTAEYKDALIKGLKGRGLIDAIGIPLPKKERDCLFELKVDGFICNDGRVYPADSSCPVPHFIEGEIADSYSAGTLKDAFLPPIDYESSKWHITPDILAQHIGYFNVYIRETADDGTEAVNKYMRQIYSELSVQVPPVKAPAEYKLEALLNGVSWKAATTGYYGKDCDGVGYTQEIKDIAKRGETFVKFAVIGGDF